MKISFCLTIYFLFLKKKKKKKIRALDIVESKSKECGRFYM